MDSETVSELAVRPDIQEVDGTPQKASASRLSFFSKWIRSLSRHPIALDNLPLIALVIAYILGVYAANALFGIHGKIVLRLNYSLFANLAVLFSAFLILFQMRNRSYRRYFTPRSLIGFLTVFTLAPITSSAFSSFKQTIPLIHDFSWDEALMRLDYILHWGHHPWKLLEPILSFPTLLRTIDFLYLMWFLFLFLSCLWMAWTSQRELRLCFLISFLLVWILLGSGLATIMSSAGPCYYSQVVAAGDNPYLSLMQRLGEINRVTPLYAINNEIGLWVSMQNGVWMPFGGISAMPSIHLAMAALFALLAFSMRKWLGWVFVAYAFIMQIGSVILGWHYAVDGYAGIILAVLIWLAVKRFVYRNLALSA